MRTLILLAMIAGAVGAAQQDSPQNHKKSPPKKTADKDKPPPLSKKAEESLKAIAGKITETPGVVKELKPGEFIKRKLVTKYAVYEPIKSEYAGKPIAAVVTWTSMVQESKLYPTKETAEKATEWLDPGKVAGVPNGLTKGVGYRATYFYVNDKWELGDISFGGGSLSKGDTTPWTAVTGEVPKAKDPTK